MLPKKTQRDKYDFIRAIVVNYAIDDRRRFEIERSRVLHRGEEVGEPGHPGIVLFRVVSLGFGLGFG